MRAISIYEEIKGVKGWLMPEEAVALYHLARSHGQTILEVGTYRGRSSLVLTKGAVSRWPKSQFFSLDIDAFARVHAADLLKRRCLSESALFFNGTLPNFKKRFRISPTMAFIDGDHTYEGVVADLAELATLLQPGVPVVFHDYLNPDTPGVRSAVDEWCHDGFAVLVETFGSCASVTTTDICTGTSVALSTDEFRSAQAEFKPPPLSISSRIAMSMPWLIPVVRLLRLKAAQTT